jgi:hypothetical protein
MTDYNNGEIHGWNGGDCPVHPESVVEIWLRSGGGPEKQPAGFWRWKHLEEKGDIIAFRVVEQHVEPKTIWVNEYAGYDKAYKTEAAAKTHWDNATRIAVEYREVKK